MGRVFDQIACWQIAECGAKEKFVSNDSLFDQMSKL